LSVEGLADHFGTLLEKTISAKPIKLQGQKIRDKEAPDWLIGNYAPDRDKLPTIEPIELKNGGFLRFEHRVRVLDDPGTERNINKTTTLSYSYEYSATSPDDPDWVLRYEYETEPQDPKARYPAGHLHVNAEPRDYTQIEKVKNFPLLHLPTSRLSIEKIIWHLANEHTPRARKAEKQEWFELLNESEKGHRERTTTGKRPSTRPPILDG